MDDSENHEYIYLEPPCCADTYEGRMWSQDGCPDAECEDGTEWTQYVHEDKFEALKAENAKLQGQIDRVQKAFNDTADGDDFGAALYDIMDADGKFIEADV